MNILITGASRGIGYDLVKQFAILDQVKILALSRNTEKLEQLERECCEINSKTECIPITFDLEEYWEEEKDILSLISSYIDSLDILINNAGYLLRKSIQTYSNQEIEKIFTVNTYSVLGFIRDLYPLLSRREKAHIVNIGSMAGFQGSNKYPGLSVYAASKAALASITEVLASEFKETTIKCNCLALGATQTEMFNEAFPGSEAVFSAVEMAEYIVNFAINGHKYFNGKIIPVASTNP